MTRLHSIDILRGLALAGMILVNNPGDWGHIYAPFEHAEFIGLTLADLVYPTFMFVMGLCIPLSFRKYNDAHISKVYKHIIIRTITIFAIGLFLQWMSRGFCTWYELRIPGVLQRLALCYGIAAIMFYHIPRKFLGSIAVIILVGYSFLLSFNQGYEWSESNIIARVDHYILGANHLYIDNGIRLDPEGILSTIPCISHVLFGVVLMMEWIRIKQEDDVEVIAFKKYTKFIATFAISSLFIVFLDIYDSVPLIKKVWSASFVLITISIASILLSLLIYLVDIKHWTKYWSQFFITFGKYPLILYIISWILSDLFGKFGITWSIYQAFCSFCSPESASLLYAICFVLINWLIAFGLDSYNRIKKQCNK